MQRRWLLVLALLAPACSAGTQDGTASETSAPAPTTAPPPAALAQVPVPRTELAGAALGGRIVVAGGLTADGAASDVVHLYDPDDNRWEAGPALPLGLHHMGMAALGNRVYVAGGYTNRQGQDWVAQSRVFSLSVGERSWREEPSLSGPRGGLAMAAATGRLVAVGGTDDGGTLLRRTEAFVPGQRSWRAGPDMGEARDHLAAASSDGRIYAIAGRLGSLESNLASVESWDPSGSSPWRPEPRLNDTRGGTSAAEAGGRPCVAGGEEPSGTIASVECLVQGRWDRVAALQVPRHGLAVVGLGNRLHVVGGGPEPGLFVSTTHEAFTIG